MLIFVFFVLKGEYAKMSLSNEENNKDSKNINFIDLKDLKLNLENKTFDATGKNELDMETMVVYKINCNINQERELVDLLRNNNDLLKIRKIQIERNSNEEGMDEKNYNNPNSVSVSLIVNVECADGFDNRFAEVVQGTEFAELEIKPGGRINELEFSTDKSLKLSDYETKVLKDISLKKYYALMTLTRTQQIDFIDKLIKLAGKDYQKQREKIFGTSKPDEYRYVLNLIFNSNYLTYEALLQLANFLCQREIPAGSLINFASEIKNIWESIFTDLSQRDISGKRDRLKVMIGPEFHAINIAAHIKVYQSLKSRNYLQDENAKKEFYKYIIEVAEREYSKLNKEFWWHFLLYVVGLSFLVPLSGVIVTALLSLTGLESLVACMVLLVATLITTGFRFHSDYKIWPWDWVYWWKDAKSSCLACLKSQYMKDVFLNGNTATLDERLCNKDHQGNENYKDSDFNFIKTENMEMNKITDKNEDKDENEDKNSLMKNQAQVSTSNFCVNQLQLYRNKKSCKERRKLYCVLFLLSAIIFIVDILTYFSPSVVATAISLLLSVFKIELVFTISPVFESIALYVAIIAVVAAILFYIAYHSKYSKYKQLKFDVYQKNYARADDGKYFAKLKGEHGYFTSEELRKNGIELPNPEVVPVANEEKNDNDKDENDKNSNIIIN